MDFILFFLARLPPELSFNIIIIIIIIILLLLLFRILSVQWPQPHSFLHNSTQKDQKFTHLVEAIF
jgi:hypothetical protein